MKSYEPLKKPFQPIQPPKAREECKNDVLTFFDRSQACPCPKVLSVEPMSAPIMGKTILTIKGKNFGREMETKIAQVKQKKIYNLYFFG